MARTLRLLIGLLVSFVAARPAESSALQDLERDLASLLGAVSPSVVTVRAVFRNAPSGPIGSSDVLNVGTGLLVDPGGYIITSSDIVNEPSQLPYSISVVDGRDSTHAAMLFGVDPDQHVAILLVPTLAGAPTVPRRELEWYGGQLAIIIGNSYDTGPSIALSTVAGRRRVDGVWLLSSPVAPGFSGAPVFDTGGRWGGIVVGEAASPRVEDRARLNPAVMEAVRHLTPLLDRISRLSEAEQRPWLGLRLGTRVDDNGQMVIFVRGLYGDGPAARSGVEVDDVIIGLDNYPVYFMLDFAEALARLTPGQTAMLHVLRDGRPRSLPVTVEQR